MGILSVQIFGFDRITIQKAMTKKKKKTVDHKKNTFFFDERTFSREFRDFEFGMFCCRIEQTVILILF